MLVWSQKKVFQMIILSQSTSQTLSVPEGGDGRVQQRLCVVPASPDSYAGLLLDHWWVSKIFMIGLIGSLPGTPDVFP